MDDYATWEGASTLIVRIKNGKVFYEPLGTRGKDYIKRESYKKPIGVIIENAYDNKGKVLKNRNAAIFYKGKDVEVLGAEDLDHPDIFKLETALSARDDNMEGQYLPNVMYERGIKPHELLRKKKPAKPKPKRKVVKKCKCK